MKNRLKIAVVFGGRSAEHEVSLQSAKNIISALDRNKYEPILIGIDKNGRWLRAEEAKFLLNETDPKLISLNASTGKEVALLSGHQNNQLIGADRKINPQSIDVVFPVLHGPFGEDGTIQGLLKLANLPFVGASVLGSAVGMDKDVCKRLLRDAGIPIAKFMVFHKGEKVSFEKTKDNLGLPLFIKPANLGSSVGVSKVKNEKEFKIAVSLAFEFDTKILIEETVNGREIECSVLGNEKPIASVAGEIIPTHEFYSYEAKYIDENGARLQIPAKISKKTLKIIQDLAVKTFKTLCCEGMARVDFFLKDSGDLPAGGQEVLVNEINTIPGFTKISMYPKLWEASGLPYKKLIDKLIQLAEQRFERDKYLKSSY